MKSTKFDEAFNKFLTENYEHSEVYQPHERIDDRCKFKNTLAHIGVEHEDEEIVDQHFKNYKGRTMAEAIKELTNKTEDHWANQQSIPGANDTSRGQVKTQPQDVCCQGNTKP